MAKTLVANTKNQSYYYPPLEQLNTNIKFELLPTPVKSSNDKKEYRVIRLENGLTACLISDRASLNTVSKDESDKENTVEGNEDGGNSKPKKSSAAEQKLAAAALCVNVGSFSDPKSIPGLAHFLEHMVFMGSEKFPNENDFDSYLSKRGGITNATTRYSKTTYYFQCLDKHFYTALDKFAQFFIAPLMKEDSITREREAVESEFQMSLQSNAFRRQQMLANIAKKDSPANAFSCGNLTTLKDNVTDDELYKAVHDFRKRHYSAHRMTLAVQANLPMEILQAYVLDCFGHVPSNNLPPDDFAQFKDMFNTPEFTKVYYVQPSKETTSLELIWALPPLLHEYKAKPLDYVSCLLGDEGKGSLLSFLRKKSWVLNSSAGSVSDDNPLYTLYGLNLELTDDGLEHVPEITEYVFSYLKMLRELGPQERIYLERKSIDEAAFKFRAEPTPAKSVKNLSMSMHLYPPQDYIIGSELFLEYDPKCIKMVLDSLLPNKMCVIVMNKNPPQGMSFSLTEKWFGTKYAVQDIPSQWLQKWQNATLLPQFSLPPPNQFLARDFTIVEEDPNNPEYPEKVLENEHVELWFRKDQKFKLPIAYYFFNLISPLSQESASAQVMTHLFIDILQYQLAEEAYPAKEAELSYSLNTSSKGITVQVSGYNEKLHVLIELITNHLINLSSALTEEIFEVMKNKVTQFYHNLLMSPSTLENNVRLNILIKNTYLMVDKYNAISSVTLATMQQFAKDFVSKLYLKALVQGNLNKEDAINAVNNIISTLQYKPLEPNTYPELRVVELPKGESLCKLSSFNVNDSVSVITHYYQSGLFSIRECVTMEIILRIMKEPLFNTLRTKEQLGYKVNCFLKDIYGILGFAIAVTSQATKYSTGYVDSRIEEFMKKASELLSNISSQSFEEIKANCIRTKQVTDLDLKHEVVRNWVQIISDYYIFDRLPQEIKTFEEIQLADITKWWDNHCNPINFRKLSVQVAGFNINNVEEVVTFRDKDKLSINFLDDEQAGKGKIRFVVKDMQNFKENLHLFPVLKTFKQDSSTSSTI